MTDLRIPPEIITVDGEYLSFIEPEKSKFDITTIAHGLSLQCRWGNQCRELYTVAQHSVYVSLLVHPSLAMHGLLHDGAEAFMGDMTSPLKQLLPEYKDIEDHMLSVIFGRFGIAATDEHKRAVKEADRCVEATERRDVMVHPHDASHSDLVKGHSPLAMRIRPWHAEKAKALFLHRFASILNGHHDRRETNLVYNFSPVRDNRSAIPEGATA